LGETNDKHVGLYPRYRDAKRNRVWLPLAEGRGKKRWFWDFATASSHPAPVSVHAVSPTGVLYRIDENITRLGDDLEPVWSIPASTQGKHALLTASVSFCGQDDRVLYEHPDEKGGWGVLHVVDAATGEVLARRPRETGEAFELPLPGRFIGNPGRSRILSLDDLTWRDLAWGALPEKLG